ncbi:hypothetical protein L596_019968 [Steinernema carpocapsae]|uniref:Uncharacterized protein n=1 Tax=Steinernema carpocapsae TaxID=34508 RepID=A0A4U5MS52_STECR|nr:hypothetical protein L596_019968 [Steinernema carpocapsae]
MPAGGLPLLLTTGLVFVILAVFAGVADGYERIEGRIENGPPLNTVHAHIEWVPILSRRNVSELMKDAFEEVVEELDEEKAPKKIHQIGDMLSKSYDRSEKDAKEGQSHFESLANQQYDINKSASTSQNYVLVLLTLSFTYGIFHLH